MDSRIAALPQQKPFLFVDAIVRIEPGKSVEVSVTFPPDHPVFLGHLPGNPIVPGVILVEALAQACGIVLMPDGAEQAISKTTGYLAEVRRMRFRRLVRPGELVLLHARLERRLGSVASFAVEAACGGDAVADGEIVVGGMQ